MASERQINYERNDLFLAIVLIALSVWVIIQSVLMPRPGGWSTAPGLFPLFIGITLLGMGIGLLCSSIQREEVTSEPKTIDTELQSDFTKRFWVAIGGIFIYAFLLIPTVHFTIATFIYLFGTLWYFWKGKLYVILLLSLAATLFFSQIFASFFKVMLP